MQEHFHVNLCRNDIVRISTSAVNIAHVCTETIVIWGEGCGGAPGVHMVSVNVSSLLSTMGDQVLNSGCQAFSVNACTY